MKINDHMKASIDAFINEFKIPDNEKNRIRVLEVLARVGLAHLVLCSGELKTINDIFETDVLKKEEEKITIPQESDCPQCGKPVVLGQDGRFRCNCTIYPKEF